MRSHRPAHPAIISVETFTKAQLLRRGRRGRGKSDWSALERTRVDTSAYILRGRVRCRLCERKMEGSRRNSGDVYYRCKARTFVPGSAIAASHPPNVYLRQQYVVPTVN